MNKITRNIGFWVGAALAFICWCFCWCYAIYAFYRGVVDEDPECWIAIFVSSIAGLGCIFFFIYLLPQVTPYIADALSLGGKQMICDIIKWTIIIIIAAVVFTIAYKIAIYSVPKGMLP